MGKKKTFLAGHVGVDAGLIMIGDPGYVVEPSGEDLDLSWDEFVERVFDKDETRRRPADGEIPDVATEPLGRLQGIVIPSGYGDGIYPVYVTLADDGTPESATIVFNEAEHEPEN